MRLLRQFSFLFFLYKRHFKHLKHKQKHVTNIQPNIFRSKKSTEATFIQTNIYLRASKKSTIKHLEQKLLVTSQTNYFYAQKLEQKLFVTLCVDYLYTSFFLSVSHVDKTCFLCV